MVFILLHLLISYFCNLSAKILLVELVLFRILSHLVSYVLKILLQLESALLIL